MPEPLRLRILQLDLDRQYETLETVFSLLEFASEHRFNACLLSLGDRVESPALPYRRKAGAYSPEDIRRIVRRGGEVGLEIIPCVPTLGHAEKFLSHPEMEELAELRGGRTGRWGDSSKIDFCASNPKVFEFFERYFSDLAELFPSKWFHAGWDESWNIGFCDSCREEAQKPGGEGRLCLGNLLRTHAILKKLGRRMIVWDDMFEYYPEILERVPRDVVFANWQYQREVRGYEAHFVDLAREKRLERYDELGFEYLIAPADYTAGNIRSFVRYASGFRPIGGILTLWGKKLFFYWKSLPAVAYAGALFAGEDESAALDSARKTLSLPPDSPEAAALRCAMESSWIHGDMIVNPSVLGTVSAFGDDPAEESAIELVLKTFRNAPENRGTEDLSAALEGALLRRRIARKFHRAWRENVPVGDLAGILEEIDRRSALREKMWRKWRPGVEPCETALFYEEAKGFCRSFAEKIAKRSRCVVRFVLPNQYGAPRTRITLLEKGREIPAGEGVFKLNRTAEDDWDKSRFEAVFFPERPCTPDSLRIEVDSFGGTGIEFAEYANGDVRYCPSSVKRISGTVLRPEHLLTDDARFVWLGSGDVRRDFSDRSAAAFRHTAEWTLSPV